MDNCYEETLRYYVRFEYYIARYFLNNNYYTTNVCSDHWSLYLGLGMRVMQENIVHKNGKHVNCVEMFVMLGRPP